MAAQLAPLPARAIVRRSPEGRRVGLEEGPDSTLVSEEQWVLPLLLLLAAASFVPIWITPTPPLQDLPNHLVKVDIIRRYLQGDAEVRAVYALNLTLLSNYLCYVVILLLAPLTGRLPAAKLFITGYLVALPLSAYAWLRRVNPGNALLALDDQSGIESDD